MSNGTHPESDSDRKSPILILYHVWNGLEFFEFFPFGLARFSATDFEDACWPTEGQPLVESVAGEAVSHITLLSNIFGPAEPPHYTYVYQFNKVREFLDFGQKLTRIGQNVIR